MQPSGGAPPTTMPLEISLRSDMSMKTRIVARAIKVVEDDIPAILIGATSLILVIDVAGRYLFNHPIRGANELALICFLLLTYLGASGVMRKGEHISIDVVKLHLPVRWARVLDILVGAVIVTTSLFIVIYAIHYLSSGRFTSFPLTGVSRWWFVLLVVVSFSAMAAHAVHNLVPTIRGIFSRLPPSGGNETPTDTKMEGKK